MYPQKPSYWETLYSFKKREEYRKARIKEAFNDLRSYCNKKPEEIDQQELYKRAGTYRVAMQWYGMNRIKGSIERWYPGGLKGYKICVAFTATLWIAHCLAKK